MPAEHLSPEMARRHTRVVQVVMHVALVRAGQRAALGVESKRPVAAALLASVALAHLAALGLVQLLERGQVVAAVAFAAILGAGDAEALGGAVVDARRVADQTELREDLAA